MQTHTALGRDAIQAAEDMMDARAASCASPGDAGRQEFWDGSGYPEGLKGDMIWYRPPHGGGRRLSAHQPPRPKKPALSRAQGRSLRSAADRVRISIPTSSMPSSRSKRVS